MTRSQTPPKQMAKKLVRLLRVERPDYQYLKRVRTGDAIVSGPVMLIGSYRSFPCVALHLTYLPPELNGFSS